MCKAVWLFAIVFCIGCGATSAVAPSPPPATVEEPAATPTVESEPVPDPVEPPDAPGPDPAPSPEPPPTPAPPPAPEPPAPAPLPPGARRDLLAPGRYFATAEAGCWWERRDAQDQPIARFTMTDAALQVIVDVTATDGGLVSSQFCGSWRPTRIFLETPWSIRAGIYLVGTGQLASVPYTSYDAMPGCRWEIVSSFDMLPSSVIMSGTEGTGIVVAPLTTAHTGFRTNAACGRWLVSGITPNGAWESWSHATVREYLARLHRTGTR